MVRAAGRSPDWGTHDSTDSTADHRTDPADEMRESYLNAEEIGKRIEKSTTTGELR
jgi:hypothetical protein